MTVATLEGATKRIEADVLLPFFGLSMSLGPIADWGLALERNQIEVDPATAATSKPGIFGVGDVVTYPGKLKLIRTGFAEAAIAALLGLRADPPRDAAALRVFDDLGRARRLTEACLDDFCSDPDLGYLRAGRGSRPARSSGWTRPID